MTGSLCPLLIQEYGRRADYARHAARLARSGWHPVEVVERHPPRRLLDRVTLGLWSILVPLRPELRVTYSPRVAPSRSR